MTTDIRKAGPPPIPPRHNREYYESSSKPVVPPRRNREYYEDNDKSLRKRNAPPATPKRISSRANDLNENSSDQNHHDREQVTIEKNNINNTILFESKEFDSSTLENEIMNDLKHLSDHFKLSEDKLTLYEEERDDKKTELDANALKSLSSLTINDEDNVRENKIENIPSDSDSFKSIPESYSPNQNNISINDQNNNANSHNNMNSNANNHHNINSNTNSHSNNNINNHSFSHGNNSNNSSPLMLEPEQLSPLQVQQLQKEMEASIKKSKPSFELDHSSQPSSPTPSQPQSLSQSQSKSQSPSPSPSQSPSQSQSQIASQLPPQVPLQSEESPVIVKEKERHHKKSKSSKSKSKSSKSKSKDEKEHHKKSRKAKDEKRKSKKKSTTQTINSDITISPEDEKVIFTLKEREQTQRKFLLREQEKLGELNQKQYLLAQHQYNLTVNQKKQYDFLKKSNQLEKLIMLQQQQERENVGFQQAQNELAQQVAIQQQTITNAIDIHNNIVRKLISYTGESAENYALTLSLPSQSPSSLSSPLYKPSNSTVASNSASTSNSAVPSNAVSTSNSTIASNLNSNSTSNSNSNSNSVSNSNSTSSSNSPSTSNSNLNSPSYSTSNLTSSPSAITPKDTITSNSTSSKTVHDHSDSMTSHGSVTVHGSVSSHDNHGSMTNHGNHAINDSIMNQDSYAVQDSMSSRDDRTARDGVNHHSKPTVHDSTSSHESHTTRDGMNNRHSKHIVNDNMMNHDSQRKGSSSMVSPAVSSNQTPSPVVNNSYYDEGVYSVSGFSVVSGNTSVSEDFESVSILTDQLQQSIVRRPTFQKPITSYNQKVRIGGSDPETFQATLNAYRLNVKNASDPALQFEYAKFLIEAANDQYENGSSASNAKHKNDLFDEGFKFLKKLSNAGYPDAQHYLATSYKQDGDWEKAYPLFLQAAKHNHPIASYEIASYYESKKNYKKASQYYKKSASQGYPLAMHRLGTAALHGEMHMRKDVKNAIKWLKRAAVVANKENNGAASAYELALLYENGMPPIVYPDEMYALELLVQAAELDYPPAQYKLGWCFEYGELGCPTDAVQSIHWFLLAAENDEPNAQFSLAGWYLTGAEGVIEPNDREAFHWASKAAEQEYVKAEYALAYFYEMGIGIEKNMNEAMNWYKIAAEHGDERAIKRLESVSGMLNEKSGSDCKIA
jgi:TPR repeat protein